MPDDVGRCLSLWTCAELARTLVRDGVVDTISPQTVQRIMQSSRLKPWRVHRRKRQKETNALLEATDQDTPRSVEALQVVCDNVSIHKGKLPSSGWRVIFKWPATSFSKNLDKIDDAIAQQKAA